MKKNLLLLAMLVSLLGLTWMLTESGVFSSKSRLEELLVDALKSPQKIELPLAELYVKDGVWLTGAGEVARAEVLDEWHKSMEAIHIARVIPNPPVKRDFFNQEIRFTIDDQVFEFGDIAPSNDSFYLSVPGDPDVYVVDLYDMGSLAVADDEKVLLQQKYQRLRDLLLYPEDRWREERLLPLLRLGGFSHWEKGELMLDGNALKDRPWGLVVMKAFSAGLQSLVVKGPIMTQKPTGISLLEPWTFIQSDGSKFVWEFYQHKSLDLIYVWVPHLGKAYSLDEPSSTLLKFFPERLMDTMFQMSFNPNKETATFYVAGKVVAESKAVQQFLQSEQTFNQLTLMSEEDCQLLEKQSRFEVRIGALHYGFRRLDKAWNILDCENGLSWMWSVPLDSQMDFVNLGAK
jgi:hypothetical protein